MASSKIVFTNSWLNNLESVTKRHRFYDIKTPGLLLEIMPSGSKIFRFRKKVEGEQQWKTIGVYPSTDLGEARDQAMKLSVRLIDKERFYNSQNELTLKELAGLYYTQYALMHCITAKKSEQSFKRWWQPYLDCKLSQIGIHQVQVCVNKLAAQGKNRAANHSLALIKAIFNWGIKRKLITTNPAVGVDKFREQRRKRFVEEYEYPRLIKAIKDYPDKRLGEFFLFCLYTGIRSGNIKAMKWVDIDMDGGKWVIPTTKNGESQSVQLSDAALDVLRSRKQNRKLPLPWVFPGGKYETGPNHITEPKDAWRRICHTAGITNLHIHDLRRSLAVQMLEGGASTATVQEQLGHKSLAAAQIYQKIKPKTAKDATDKAIEIINRYAKLG